MAKVDMRIEPNSYAYKEKKNEESTVEPNKIPQKVTPIVNSEDVVHCKKTLKSKFKSMIFKDNVDIKKYVIYDFLIPTVKKGVLNALSMSFFGEPISTKPKSWNNIYGTPSGYTGYSNYYNTPPNGHQRPTDNRMYNNNIYDYKNIVLHSRDAAERVVMTMYQYIEETGSVSIAHLFELIGVPSNWADTSYGWINPAQIRIRAVYDGFLIDVDNAQFIGG